MTPISPLLAEAASAGRLLVVSDYDGVIAPIVNDPAAADPDPAARAALLRLAELRRTYVVVLSGRARESVLSLLGEAPGLIVVGSHGAESDEPLEITAAQRDVLTTAVDALRAIAASAEGATVEEKPASVALHVRNAETVDRTTLLDAVRSGPAAFPGVRAVEGKQVIELLVSSTHKGDAVRSLRQRFSPDRVVVLGDDVTDEDAFEALDAADLGIKIGAGPTRARAVLPEQTDVAAVLGELAEKRRLSLATETGPESAGDSLE